MPGFGFFLGGVGVSLFEVAEDFMLFTQYRKAPSVLDFPHSSVL